MDLKDFFLNTPLERYEYIKMKLTAIPPEIVQKYSLKEKETKDRQVYLEVRRGIYGLPQAGLLIQLELEEHLSEHGYRQSKVVSGLWHHDWRPISFTIVVDDFGVKYIRKEHAEHFLKGVLEKFYEVTTDWEGKKYIGLALDWDYEKSEVHVSILGYVKSAAKELDHTPPKRYQKLPVPCTSIKYGAKQQWVEDQSPSPPQ